MTTSNGPRRDYPCPVCGYFGVGCICHETDEVPTAPSELIILLPEHSPLTFEEQEDTFHNQPAYDNLESEDMHFLESAIRIFLAGNGDTIDMEALNWHLQIISLEKDLARLGRMLTDAE